MKTSLHHYFSQLPDPRIHRNKKHLLIDIIVLSVIAVICGAESWNSIEMFGKAKKDFLLKILKLPNGIPSHDTINRVFSLIQSGKFEQLFAQWVQSLELLPFFRQRNSNIGLFFLSRPWPGKENYAALAYTCSGLLYPRD